MSFLDELKRSRNSDRRVLVAEPIKESSVGRVNEAPKKPEEVLRGNGYKIRQVTPTSFGTQIDFAKAYNPKDIETILKDFTIKIKGKSVFIVD